VFFLGALRHASSVVLEIRTMERNPIRKIGRLAEIRTAFSRPAAGLRDRVLFTSTSSTEIT